jgi:hypothetical protein
LVVALVRGFFEQVGSMTVLIHSLAAKLWLIERVSGKEW